MTVISSRVDVKFKQRTLSSEAAERQYNPPASHTHPHDTIAGELPKYSLAKSVNVGQMASLDSEQSRGSDL